MLAKIRSRFGSAHLIALAALSVAIGGTAYSAATIDSRDVENNSIRSGDLKNDAAVKSADVKNESLGPDDLAPGSVGGSEVADNALGGADIDEASLSLGPTAAYAEVQPNGTIRKARGVTQDQISHVPPNVYCFTVNAENAVATGGLATDGTLADVYIISASSLQDLGASPMTFGCPANATFVVGTRARADDVGGASTATSAYFQILFH